MGYDRQALEHPVRDLYGISIDGPTGRIATIDSG